MLSSANATAAGNGYRSSSAADLGWPSAGGLRSGGEAKASIAPHSVPAGVTPPLRYGGDPVAATTAVPPAGHVTFPAADLVDRSAFLFGLLQSEHLVHDVHDAIVALNNVAADKTDDGDAKSRTAGGQSSSEGALSAVFYFIARPPCPDMPWRPIYTSAVLLCVFSTVEAAQRAIARVDRVVLHTMQTEVRGSASTASTAPISSPYLVLRPAREFVLGPENTDTALLTYLTTPRLVDLLLRRQRMQKPNDRVADDAEQRSAMESYARANLPPAYLCGSAARLYAAILSPQSPYAVDWAAARVAMARGDGIVVPEMSVVEPWACGGAGEYDRDKGATPAAAGSPPADRCSPPLLQGADIERRRRASVSGAAHYVPVTLQEEEYYRRYGVGSPSRTAISRARCGSVEGLTELMPSRGSLYRGAQGVLRGVSWFWRRAYESLSGKEAALISGPSSLPVAPTVPSAPPQASAGAIGTSDQVPFPASPTALSEGRNFYEPPRARHRAEGRGPDGVHGTRGGGGQPIMIPRYNAVGSALSWMPGFHYVAPLFVTGVFPLGGTAPPPPHRRRMREEECGDLESSAWSGKEAQLYGIASADAWRRDGGQVPSYSSLNHAPIPEPFSDSAACGAPLRRSEVSTVPQRAGLPPVSWSLPAQPSQLFPASLPRRAADGPQAAPGTAPHPNSLLPTPMVSSIAPSRSCMPLHDGDLASSSEDASMPALWRSRAAEKPDAIPASSRGNRAFIRVDGVHAAGGGSRAARHVRSVGSDTSLAAGTLGGSSATKSGGARPSGTLADELRAFGSGPVAGLRGRTDNQDEVRTTTADTTADAQREKKSSSRASRRTVEFSLPGETK
ncbi:protein of unknown function - conserved [Leishmania donovani]|uniref:Uncharacterized protein n=3 Tax=Leishmania donovani species complex TaxID=38574 RepID=A4HRQ1_LEIIN|nr:hypothetical protein, unknown function [Leishmania infantum JPCM5]TPP43963.1 hypothetical protein CGC20_37075 [Leishmania donovani]CAC9438025.1 hypothetical_protein_-_conserved [Leishmania infantum]CAJ1985727.1 protein of unknown function - conserved [Leishmania donovani]CAM65284.1 hypothetical protein, unknown function [Leishmania infantum JPCM5]SUZ38678.1 hypothetical_protein_-_conserved [Leishmania infantum]|eukprot:XP_001462743.1 hypothetical protein, unknown function [Leishmania infantum JPCM5]